MHQMSFGFQYGSKDSTADFVGVKDFDGVGVFFARASRGQTTSS